MVRPKSGTEAGEIATKRWRATMLKKYGGAFGLRAKMQSMGSLGGQHSKSGGFAANPALAAKAGAIGGRRSKRGKNSITETMIVPQADKIKELYRRGYSVPQISKKLEIPYGTLLRWAKEEIDEYGRD